MLSLNPIQQYIPQRLQELGRRLEKSIWTRTEWEVGISATRPSVTHCGYAVGSGRKASPVKRFPHIWGPKWAQAWFRLDIPAKALREGLYLYWDDEAEATVFVDGVPWYGFDSAHHRAPLPARARQIWIEGICARTGIWLNDGRSLSESGSHLRGASLWRRDESAWQLYWDFVVLMDLLEYEYRRCLPSQDDWAKTFGYRQPLFRVSPLLRRIMRGLEDFADAYDQGDSRAGDKLKALYASLPAGSEALTGILTGHAHIDLVWMWPERVGEAKAVHTFATANRLMELYPEFRFGYSQPASYDAVARRSPELMKQVRERIQSGQWEATGGADVESDTQLPCGEALARSFVIGQERFRDIRGGSISRVLWLPDVFGYSPCLPQILKQTGVSWFFTTKLTWGSVNRFPHSSFRWQGHDGSEVLVHVSQEVGYNGSVALPDIKKMEECQQEAGIHNEFLVPTGYGDGGGGVTPEILERARRVADLAGLPKCRWDGIEAFFERAEKVRQDLPVWQGELYLEYHRGVQTTHGDFKAAFRAAERALQVWEAAHSVFKAGPVDQQAWRRVIFNQFHDAIPGSSIREVYEELGAELLDVAKSSRRRAEVLFGDGRKNHLFNPLAQPVTVETNGRMLDLPPLGAVAVATARPAQDAVEAGPDFIRNGRLEARFNRRGEVASLIVDGRSVPLVAPAGQLWVYPDHPHAFEAWDIDQGSLMNGTACTAEAEAAVSQPSPARAEVAFARPLTHSSTVVTRYILEAESPVLRVEWDVNWQDREVLLKALFPTGYNGRMARFGAPFGSTLRPQQPGDPRTEAMYEVPASRWVLVADDGEMEGLSILTEAKYGFSVRQGTVGLSLLRSARITDSELHKGIRSLENKEPFSDIGQWTIRAAIAPYQHQAERYRMPAALADSLFQLPLPVSGKMAPASAFLGLEGGDSLVPVWVQPEADGACVIRLNETMGRRGSCQILLAKGARAELVDLLGNPLPGKLLQRGEISFEPYALIGLRVRS